MTAARCPVCGAGFRGARICSRCGADLTELMRVMIEAWRLRVSGWRALLAGDAGRAKEHAERSLELHASDSARRLASLLACGLEGRPRG